MGTLFAPLPPPLPSLSLPLLAHLIVQHPQAGGHEGGVVPQLLPQRLCLAQQLLGGGHHGGCTGGTGEVYRPYRLALNLEAAEQLQKGRQGVAVEGMTPAGIRREVEEEVGI